MQNPQCLLCLVFLLFLVCLGSPLALHINTGNCDQGKMHFV